jgi:hypothetical protein
MSMETKKARAPWRAMAALTVLGALFMTAACSSDTSGGGGSACAVDTGPSTISGNISVTYTASVLGDGAITQLKYATDGGMTTINNPALPFTLGPLALTTAHAQISATGSATNGSVTVAFGVTGGGTEQGSNTCAHGSFAN